MSADPHDGRKAPVWVQVALIVATSLIFGFQLVTFKEALQDVPPTSLVAVRSLILVPFLLAFYRVTGTPTSVRAGWRPVLAPTLLLVASQGVFIYGVHRLAAGLSSTLLSMTPIFTVGLGLLLGAERVGALALAGAAAGTVGVAIATGALHGGADTLGVVLILSCNFFYALSLIVLRRSKVRAAPADYVLLTAIVSLGVYVPLAAGVDGWALHFTWALAGSIAYMVVLGQAVAYVFTLGLLRYGGAFQATLVTPLIPVFAILFAVLLLDEPLLGRELAGGALIVAGVLAAVLPQRRPAQA